MTPRLCKKRNKLPGSTLLRTLWERAGRNFVPLVQDNRVIAFRGSMLVSSSDGSIFPYAYNLAYVRHFQHLLPNILPQHIRGSMGKANQTKRKDQNLFHSGVSSIRLASTCIGTTACIEEMDLLAMSFVIAVLPPFRHDVVFCSEGRELGLIRGYSEVTEESTIPVREDFLKTLALNPKLCIGFGGTVPAIREFLEEFLSALPWEEYPPNAQPTNFVERIALDQGSSLRDISVAECREEVREILSHLGTKKDLLPIIGGEDDGEVLLYYTKFFDDRYEILSTKLAYGAPPGFKPSAEWPSVDHIIEHHISNWDRLRSWSAEQRCLRTGELVADHSFTCNKNLMFRRLSQGFVKEDRCIINN